MPAKGTGYALGLDTATLEGHQEWTRRLNARPKAKKNKKRFAETHRIYNMWRAARDRSKQKGLPFSIEEQDVVLPLLCPVLGLVLEHGQGRHQDSSPTLDRIKPSLGYVKGNIRVISYRANRLKCDGSIAEFEAILADLRRL